MTNIFLQIHAFFLKKNHQNDYKHSNRIAWIVCNVCVRLLEVVINGMVLLRGKLCLMPRSLTDDNELVVSLTSFPARISKVWMVVDCLMRQTLRPSAILLFLSKEQFPQEKKDLPKILLRYEKLGLKIFFVEDDLKPHKKYFYACQTLHSKCFVTVDDDILYRNDMLRRLWDLHSQFPQSVCANYGRYIAIDENGTRPYCDWRVILDDKIHNNEPATIAIGFGGILYPETFYSNIELICDKKTIKETCLNADDLWLKVMELKTNTPLVISSYYPKPPSILSTKDSALSQSNRLNGRKGNDLQWEALMKLFNIDILLKSR